MFDFTALPTDIQDKILDMTCFRGHDWEGPYANDGYSSLWFCAKCGESVTD